MRKWIADGIGKIGTSDQVDSDDGFMAVDERTQVTDKPIPMDFKDNKEAIPEVVKPTSTRDLLPGSDLTRLLLEAEGVGLGKTLHTIRVDF